MCLTSKHSFILTGVLSSLILLSTSGLFAQEPDEEDSVFLKGLEVSMGYVQESGELRNTRFGARMPFSYDTEGLLSGVQGESELIFDKSAAGGFFEFGFVSRNNLRIVFGYETGAFAKKDYSVKESHNPAFIKDASGTVTRDYSFPNTLKVWQKYTTPYQGSYNKTYLLFGKRHPGNEELFSLLPSIKFFHESSRLRLGSPSLYTVDYAQSIGSIQAPLNNRSTNVNTYGTDLSLVFNVRFLGEIDLFLKASLELIQSQYKRTWVDRDFQTKSSINGTGAGAGVGVRFIYQNHSLTFELMGGSRKGSFREKDTFLGSGLGYKGEKLRHGKLRRIEASYNYFWKI